MRPTDRRMSPSSKRGSVCPCRAWQRWTVQDFMRQSWRLMRHQVQLGARQGMADKIGCHLFCCLAAAHTTQNPPQNKRIVADLKSVVSGKRVSVRVGHGGRRIRKNNTQKTTR